MTADDGPTLSVGENALVTFAVSTLAWRQSGPGEVPALGLHG
jgi:hypothetical protein